MLGTLVTAGCRSLAPQRTLTAWNNVLNCLALHQRSNTPQDPSIPQTPQPSSSTTCLPPQPSHHPHNPRHLHTSSASSCSKGPSPGALAEQLAELEARVCKLESREAVREVVHGLCLWMDAIKQHPELVTPQRVMELFTQDAALETSEQGSVQSIEEVLPFFEALARKVEFSKHHVCDLVVDINENNPCLAKARYYVVVTATVAGQAYWGLETVNAKLERSLVDDKWRLHYLKWERGGRLTSFAGPGWHKEPNAFAAGATSSTGGGSSGAQPSEGQQ